MECKIRIRDIAVYHPSKAVDNEFFFKHFEKQGKDVKHFLEDVLGRKKRYMIDNKGKKESERENSLTMQIEAAKRVLKKTNLTGKDIDGIIVATQFPEYITPPCFMYVHGAIDGKRECFGYDINTNCLGMTMAFHQASQYFSCNPQIEKMLIIAGDYLNLGVSEDDEGLYGVLGDSACAIVVERSDETSKLIDSDYFINNTCIEDKVFPRNGFSDLFENQNLDCKGNPESTADLEIPFVVEKMKKMLQRNGLSPKDLGGICVSQSVKSNVNYIKENLEIADEKCPFVAEEYGYTGGNSPFLALNKLIEKGQIKRGDYVLLWTVGSSMQHIFLLIKY